MHINQSIKVIEPSHPMFPFVIKDSIGLPTPSKIKQVLQRYADPHWILLGAFVDQNLVGVIGVENKASNAIIKHLSVLEPFRRKGFGKALVLHIAKYFPINTIQTETDVEAVKFYKTLGFQCRSFKGEYGTRYLCSIDISKTTPKDGK